LGPSVFFSRHPVGCDFLSCSRRTSSSPCKPWLALFSYFPSHSLCQCPTVYSPFARLVPFADNQPAARSPFRNAFYPHLCCSAEVFEPPSFSECRCGVCERGFDGSPLLVAPKRIPLFRIPNTPYGRGFSRFPSSFLMDFPMFCNSPPEPTNQPVPRREPPFLCIIFCCRGRAYAFLSLSRRSVGVPQMLENFCF